MPKIYDKLTAKKAKDIEVLGEFTAIFCSENHNVKEKAVFIIKDERLQSLNDKQIDLCPDCTRLLNHGIAKLLQCPHDPKPMCKKCTTQCYAPGYRESMREVMKFSGLYLVKHGRLDLMVHHFL